MKNERLLLIICIALFAILVLGGLFVFLRGRGYFAPGTGGSPSGVDGEVSFIQDFSVQKPNFVAVGENLSKVEVWYAATAGTDGQLLGPMRLETGTGASQRWILPIPSSRIQAAEIYARGYNRSGQPVAKISLQSTTGIW